MQRTPSVGGNWKMNGDRREAVSLARGVAERIGQAGAAKQVGVTVFPPFCYLIPVAEALGDVGGDVKVGGQDAYFEPNGAYTGEVSLSMLRDVGATAVLVGHSERRHVLGEPDTLINEKLLAALEAGFDVTLCVGETLEQREAGQTDAVNVAQTMYGLAGVKAEQMARVTLAYEPVWAIGTGKTATAEDAQAAHACIRRAVSQGLFDERIGEAVRIQYGGSVKPKNAAELFAQPDIDGGLIGGASLKPDDFAAIVDAAAGG